MTLITFGTSGGERRQCDAKCYNATSPHCDCICGGANHGKGETAAIRNTQEAAERWIAGLKAKHPDGAAELPALQLTICL